MAQSQLLMTPVVTQALQSLVKRAHGHRLSHATLALRKVVPEEHRLAVPHGFIVYLDTATTSPASSSSTSRSRVPASGRPRTKCDY
jgi:hypothetical protein